MATPALTYHIGDIHGRADLLQRLVAHVESEADSRGVAPVFSFLGDLVDRGPDSKQCMETVHGVLEKWRGSVLHLGNHDEWFLEAILTDGEFTDVDSWIRHGGIQTIESYGKFDMEALKRIRQEFPHHVEMLKAAALYTRSGPFIAVHAGIDPSMPLEAQKPSNFNWIRDEFLMYVEPKMTPVVHGHTVVGRLPVVTENRVSIDTGAYDTGRLTCFVVDGERRLMSFVQSTDGGIVPVEPWPVDRGHGTLLDRIPSLFEEAAELEHAP